MADVISMELLQQYRRFEPVRYRALAALIDAGEIVIEEIEQAEDGKP